MDKYDEAIEWLVKNPRHVSDAWQYPRQGNHGCLFELVGDHALCGCLTQIRFQVRCAPTPELTQEIRDDAQIVGIGKLSRLRGDALRAALQPFAFWQRRLDREIRGVQEQPV